MTNTTTLRIGIDLDGVTYDFVESMRSYLVLHRGFRRHNLPEPNTWAMWDAWPMSREEWLNYFSDGVEAGIIFGGGYNRGITGALTMLPHLKRQGHTLHIVTHRPPAAERTTVKWLAEVGLDHDGLTFSGDKTVEPVDVMTEDNISNAIACAEAGIPVLLLDQAWNRQTWEHEGEVHDAHSLVAAHPLIRRVYGWGDIAGAIEDYARVRAERGERIKAAVGGLLLTPEDATNPKDRIGLTKPRVDLVPPAAIIEMAGAMANGAEKYGAYNWRSKDVRSTVYVAALIRHALAYLDGEDVAADSGVSHLGHIMACAAILTDATHGGHLVDDRPPPGSAARLIAERTIEA